MMALQVITERSELIAFHREHGMRPDWHEPDEQGIWARVEGVNFDNAGFWPIEAWSLRRRPETAELHVIFSKVIDSPEHDECDREITTCGHRTVTDIAAVNLATLCAWATGSD